MVEWGKLIFGDVDSSDYGIYITGEGVYNAPERAVEFVDVPGRNGAIVLDQGRFNNITLTYPAGTFGKTQEEFREAVRDFRNAVMSLRGYQRLEDSYHPDEYRMAIYVVGLEVSPVHYGTAGEFEIVFECKPQRWLSCGDYPVPVESGQFVDNPTRFDSKPILLTEGYGMINFNGYSIGLTNEPMGRIKLESVSNLTDSTGYGISFVVDFKQYRLEPDDPITIVNTYTLLGAQMQFIPTDEVSNVSISSLTNLIQGDFQYYDTENPSAGYIIWFWGYPTNDIVFSYGTSEYKSHSAVLSFDIGSTTYTYDIAFNLYYDGDKEITVSQHLRSQYPSPEVPALIKKTFDFRLNRWYLDSTFPTWNQDFEYVVIDCDLGEAYGVDDGGYVSLNQWVNFGSDLPDLKPGQNKVTFDNTVVSLKIKPRWWRV